MVSLPCGRTGPCVFQTTPSGENATHMPPGRWAVGQPRRLLGHAGQRRRPRRSDRRAAKDAGPRRRPCSGGRDRRRAGRTARPRPRGCRCRCRSGCCAWSPRSSIGPGRASPSVTASLRGGVGQQSAVGHPPISAHLDPLAAGGRRAGRAEIPEAELLPRRRRRASCRRPTPRPAPRDARRVTIGLPGWRSGWLTTRRSRSISLDAEVVEEQLADALLDRETALRRLRPAVVDLPLDAIDQPRAGTPLEADLQRRVELAGPLVADEARKRACRRPTARNGIVPGRSADFHWSA